MIYEIKNLNSARHFLANTTKKVTIINSPGSTRYYGMRVINYIFQTLQKEFPSKISGFIVNAYNDYSAFTTARKLGYSKIQYRN